MFGVSWERPSATRGLTVRTRIPLQFVVLLVAATFAPSAVGYIDFPPTTLPKLCHQSTNIRVLAVTQHDKEKGVVVYEAVDTLKGTNPKITSFKHALRTELAGRKPILDWVEDKKRAVMFTIEWDEFACGYVFIDEFCYSVDYNRKGNFWLLIRVDPEMAATYFGSAELLQKVARDILAGKDVKVPVDAAVKHLTVKDREKQLSNLDAILSKNRAK